MALEENLTTLAIFIPIADVFNLSIKVHFYSHQNYNLHPPPTNILSHRAQIGETTDTLNRLEGDLTIVQDSNSEASKELSALEREAKELNLTSEQLHRQLDILKNSNFLGETECCL